MAVLGNGDETDVADGPGGQGDAGVVFESGEEDAAFGAGAAHEQINVVDGFLVSIPDLFWPDGAEGDVVAAVDFGHADSEGVGAAAIPKTETAKGYCP